MKLFAVAGNPILHSRSPQMFQAAFKALGMDNYYYLRFASSRAEEIVQAMREMPISGFNVTSPFKEEIVPFLDDVDDAARRIGAVNLIVVEGGRLKGFNTDIMGVEHAFLENGVDIGREEGCCAGRRRGRKGRRSCSYRGRRRCCSNKPYL